MFWKVLGSPMFAEERVRMRVGVQKTAGKGQKGGRAEGRSGEGRQREGGLCSEETLEAQRTQAAAESRSRGWGGETVQCLP